MTDLTKTQRRVLNTIVDFVDENGYPPTVRELAGLCGNSSPAPMHTHLRNLEAAGYVWRDASKPRALRVLEPTP